MRHFASQRCATKPKPVNKIIFLSSRRRSPLYVNPKNRRVYLNQAHALALMKTGSLAGHTRYAEDAPPIAKDRATGRLSAVASGADRWVFPLYLRTVYAKHGNRHPRAAATTLDPRLRREFDTWLQRRRP